MAHYSFSFRAPTLFDASAATAEREDLRRAPDWVRELATFEKAALWLKSRLMDKGIAAAGPLLDQGGWCLEFPWNDGAKIICIVSCEDDEMALFIMNVFDLDGARDDFGQIIEDILRSSSEIEELKAM
jgi:hypothetical protein